MSNTNTYSVTNLVSNNSDNHPQLLDPYVSLGWGIAIRPAGFGGHFWINNSGTGTVTEYVGDVGDVPIYQDALKVVEVTPGEGNPFGISGPTGQVFNASDNFVITQDHPNGDITAPSKFIFVATDGGISGWTERRNEDGSFDRPLESEVVVNKLFDSIYYGAAITDFESDNRLYAADFGATPDIEVYDASFNEITEEFDFINPFESEGYAEYNIQLIDGSLFVAYAQPNPELPGDEVIESGLGRVAEFDLEGNLISIWDDDGLLNAPWGFVAAPDDFGQFSNALLVSNFGDGTIVAFDRETKEPIDYLRDGDGEPIAIDGLWGLTFGNGASLGESNDLYFAAGNDLGDNAGDGVFGKVEVANDIPIPDGGDETFTGTPKDDLLTIGGDNNIITTNGGNDTVTARGDNQTIDAGDGNNIISIGSGQVIAGDGNNFVGASNGSTVVNTGTGNDSVNLVQGDNNVDAGYGDNHIVSGAGDDEILAGSGDDTVHAGAGDNNIDLGEGDNLINSLVNQGNFLLSVGNNTITTGNGADTFQIAPGEGVATITNFDTSDRFELKGFKPDFSGAIDFSDLTISQSGADTVITLTGTEDVLAILQNTDADTIDNSYFLGETMTENPTGELPVVSITTSTDSLNEAEGTPLTINIEATGDFPEEGIVFRTDENFFPNSQLDFNLLGDFSDPEVVSNIVFTDFEETETGQFVIDWTLTAPQGFFQLAVFDDNIAEEDTTFSVGLLPVDGSTLDPDARNVDIFVTDGVDNTGGAVVDISADKTEITEGDTLTLTLTAEGEIPADGLEVTVETDVVGALGDFISTDEQGIPSVTVEGLAGLPESNGIGSGFIATMTENTATITLDVFADDEVEGEETFNFRIIDGENYDSTGEITLSISDRNPESRDEGNEDSLFEPVFGSLDSDTIEVEGTSQLIFAGENNDLIDATTGEGNNRIYAGSGDDTLILGTNDRVLAGVGNDRFFATSGGNNTITGGAGADQFWIASAELPDSADTVTDFVSSEDVIGIAGLNIGFGDVTLTQQGSDALIGADGNDLALLENVDITDLGSDDFAFG